MKTCNPTQAIRHFGPDKPSAIWRLGSKRETHRIDIIVIAGVLVRAGIIRIKMEIGIKWKSISTRKPITG